jgi:hypothetical protein
MASFQDTCEMVLWLHSSSSWILEQAVVTGLAVPSWLGGGGPPSAQVTAMADEQTSEDVLLLTDKLTDIDRLTYH